MMSFPETYMVDGKNLSADECRSIFSSSKLGDRQLQVLDLLEGDRILDVVGEFVFKVKRRHSSKTVMGVGRKNARK